MTMTLLLAISGLINHKISKNKVLSHKYKKTSTFSRHGELILPFFFFLDDVSPLLVLRPE